MDRNHAQRRESDLAGRLSQGATSPRATVPSTRFTPEIGSALLVLLDAAECARDARTDVWQFSVEISVLRQLGLTKNDCRWLISQGLAKHACERTTHKSDRRTFQPYPNLALPKGSCFVIAEHGAAYAKALLGSEAQAGTSFSVLDLSRNLDGSDGEGSLSCAPTWDSDRQQLRVGRTVVKEFKVPAVNQQAVLAAFQEENWVPRIDDPLPPSPNQDPKRRLHSTINCLNRNQKRPLIRFLGDGSGEGVRWEFVSAQEAVHQIETAVARF